MKRKSGTIVKKRAKRPRRTRVGVKRSIIARSVHWFKRRGTATVITGDNVQNARFLGFTFTLSSLINASELSALYDQFKVTGISLKFYLNRNLGNAAVVNGVRPRMYIVTDYDTSTPPAGFDELREYSNCRVWNFNDAVPMKYWLKPKVLMETYRTAVSTATAPRRPPWMSVTHLDTQHFGIRLGIENILDSDVTIVIEPTFYFGMKNVK